MKILYLIISLIAVNLCSFAQSNFSKGFSVGYAEGYCYNDYGCIAPITPVAPLPAVGESADDYRDGYNRGFLMGQEDKKKKQTGVTTNTNAGNFVNYQPGTSTYVSQYVPIDYSSLYSSLMKSQQEYETKAFLYGDKHTAMLKLIKELQLQTSEVQFLSELKIYHDQLFIPQGTFVTMDEAYFAKIDQIEINLTKSINAYNFRMNDPTSLYNNGLTELKKENQQLALEYFERSLMLNSNCAYCNYYIGYIKFSNLNWTDAVTYLSNFIKVDSSRTQAFFYRGYSYFELGNYQKSIQDYTNLIELESAAPNYISYFYRAWAKSKFKDHYGAISDYNESIKLNPKYSMSYNNLAYTQFQIGKNSEALLNVNKAIELDSTNHHAFMTRAEINFTLKKYTEVIEDCNTSIKLNPNDGLAYFFRGRANYRLGNKENACVDWSKAGEVGYNESYTYIQNYCQ